MKYDKTDVESIATYAKVLEGKTFRDVLENADLSDEEKEKIEKKYNNARNKGGLGQFIEDVYFGYSPNSYSGPDFKEAGVELKQTVYEKTKEGKYRAGERLSLMMIDYKKPVESDFFTSHLWNKISKILLIYYFRDKTIENLDRRIDYVRLFTPAEEDLKIIESDYKKIIEKIKEGKAHELSEGDTLYLGASTKGANASKSVIKQYYNPDTLAKKRGFSFKQSYMSTILNQIISKGYSAGERIIDSKQLQKKAFEEVIIDRLNSYKGKSDEELCGLLDCKYNGNKSQWVNLAYRMLGIKSNKAEEFTKANIVVKTVRVEENGKIKENLSFSPFKFLELIKQQWEDSDALNYFEQTKFLFIIYKGMKGNYIFSEAKFWNMPTKDLEEAVQLCWRTTVSTIKKGVTFERRGKRVFNNLPSSKDNRVMHVRPHANKSAYKFKDGTEIGDIQKDANELPDGQWMTHQSFWLNKSYMETIILGNEDSNKTKI